MRTHTFSRLSLALGLSLGLAALSNAATPPAGWPAGYTYHDYPARVTLPHQSNPAFALKFRNGRVDFSRIPLQDATFVRVFGNGKHKIAMYADPNCKETQAWEKWANKNLKDATVYTFAIPLIHGDNDSFTQQFVCRSTNAQRAHAWEQWLFTGHAPAKIPDCHSTIPLAFAHALREPGQTVKVLSQVEVFGLISPFFVSDAGYVVVGAATGSNFYSVY